MVNDARAIHLPVEAIQETLAWLGQTMPKTLVLICPPDSAVKAAVEAAAPDAQLLHLAPEADHHAQLAGRLFDLAVVADTLERLPTQQGVQLLGRLRDLHTRRYLLLVRYDADWGNTDLIALGLKRCAVFGTSESRLGLYRFNIDDYKDTPDWLNPRFWAHPERWGKDRW